MQFETDALHDTDIDQRVLTMANALNEAINGQEDPRFIEVQLAMLYLMCLSVHAIQDPEFTFAVVQNLRLTADKLEEEMAAATPPPSDSVH